jgi:hypothetical protein
MQAQDKAGRGIRSGKVSVMLRGGRKERRWLVVACEMIRLFGERDVDGLSCDPDGLIPGWTAFLDEG